MEVKANPYVWNFGDMIGRNLTTGDTIKIHLKNKGWISKKDFKVTGEVQNSEGETFGTLSGKWNENLEYTDLEDDKIEVIRQKHPYQGMDYMYNWPETSLNLNKLDMDLLLHLPPTDSRFRTDNKALEFRDLEMATEEKLRMEISQRKRRKERNETKAKINTVWFQEYFDEDSQEKTWGYVGGYWETRFNYYSHNCHFLKLPLPKKGNFN